MRKKVLLRQLVTSAAALRQWSPRRQIGAMKSFMQYAQAFEQAYEADDWSLLEQRMSEDVIWTVSGIPAPIGGAFAGRAEVLDAIERSVNYFDRRFDRRLPRAVQGPIPIPGGIFLAWAVVYRRAGLPDIELRGQEWDFFQDGKLEHHRETFDNTAEVLEFIERHRAGLLPEK